MDRSALTVGPGMDIPIMHDSDRYELVRDIGSGNFGIARLMRDKQTGELVAVKYIERGEKVSVIKLPLLLCLASFEFTEDFPPFKMNWLNTMNLLQIFCFWYSFFMIIVFFDLWNCLQMVLFIVVIELDNQSFVSS